MKRRIVVSIVGVAAVAVLVLGVPLAFAFAHLYESQEVLRLERAASEMRTTVDISTLASGDPVELPNRTTTRFAVYNTSGRRIAGDGPAIADGPVRGALLGDVGDERHGGRITVAVPINGSEQVIGALRASKPASDLVARTRRTWFVMALISIAALAIATLLALGQARRLTRPIDSLVTAADRLGSGDFSVRTQPSHIQELDHLGGALDTTAERLSGLVARERAFSADASHQLRTPIAGLRVQIEAALMTPDADLHAALTRTLEPIDRLEATVDDLLRLARDTQIDRSPVDLTRLVGDVDRDWHAVLAAAGRPLRIVTDADLPNPAVSQPAIRQILDVLVDNAQRHGAGVVTIGVHRVPRGVAVTVDDEGNGVIDTQAAFTRRAGNGHGIGLAFARTLAEAEGGRLVLEHTGPAPRFALLLPVDDA